MEQTGDSFRIIIYSNFTDELQRLPVLIIEQIAKSDEIEKALALALAAIKNQWKKFIA